jgi:putative ABC transport system permease protein
VGQSFQSRSKNTRSFAKFQRSAKDLGGRHAATIPIWRLRVWIPTNLNKSSFITGFGLQPNELLTIGRLKRDVSLQAASDDLGAIAKFSEKDYPAWFRANYRIVVNSLRDESVGHFKATLFAMLAAVFILVLIGCSNVANLSLARATVRKKEIVIRASMGATRSRLIRQLLVESSLLAAAGCIGGCLSRVARVERNDSCDSS